MKQTKALRAGRNAGLFLTLRSERMTSEEASQRPARPGGDFPLVGLSCFKCPPKIGRQVWAVPKDEAIASLRCWRCGKQTLALDPEVRATKSLDLAVTKPSYPEAVRWGLR